MRYLVTHETRLAFADPVREHHCELRLQPADRDTQRVHQVELTCQPASELHTYVDYFGNRVHHFAVIAPHTQLVTLLRADVETSMSNPFDYPLVMPAHERAWIQTALRNQPTLWDFVLHYSPATPDLRRLTLPGISWPTHDQRLHVVESVRSASAWLAATLEYRAGVTTVDSTLEDVFDARAGVCQDFAHTLVAIVRSWGFAARYVVGYHPISNDVAATLAPHAWAEVLVPGAGWRGFDPTTQLVADDTYIAVAVGRDYLDAAPQRGSFKGEGGTTPEVTLHVIQQ